MTARKPYVRATAKQRERRSKKIVAMAEKGLNGVQIAKKLKLPNTTVYETLRAAGVRPRQVQTASALRRRVGATGYLAEAIANQGPEFEKWLQKNVPEGLSLAEFVVSCAVDAFQEENTAA